MGFERYLAREQEVFRKLYLFNKFSDSVYRNNLVEKFFGGKSLEERTYLGPQINLESRCSGDFSTEVLGNVYCSLSSFSDKLVQCPYLSTHRDQNGLLPCLNPLKNKSKNIVELTEEESMLLFEDIYQSTKH